MLYGEHRRLGAIAGVGNTGGCAMPLTGCIALVVAALLSIDSNIRAADSQSMQAKPQSLQLFPEAIAFQYLGDQQQVVVLAKLADGSTLDVTNEAKLSLSGAQRPVEILAGNRIRATHGGTAELRASWQELTTSADIATQAESTSRPLRFRNDVLPVLTRAGCNTGKCHGSASGKDGFRLSLYGFDPQGDYYRLTQEMSGRRINCANPDACLLINKALGEVPHSGGTCLELGSPEYQTLVSWIAAGAQADPDDVPLPTSIDVYPRQIVMSQPGLEQQLIVLARYNDGSTRDVSDLAVFISNNDAVASVRNSGQVSATGPGSGFIMARFDQFTAGTSIVVRSGKAFPELDLSLPIISTNWLPSGGEICMSNHRPYATMRHSSAAFIWIPLDCYQPWNSAQHFSATRLLTSVSN